MEPLYFEDLEVGETRTHGEITLSKAEILEFAKTYDPQPFHMDEEAAQETIYDGLIASGWQTAAICMRLMVDGFLRDVASQGGKGADELRWYRPVRPGDTLSLDVEIVEKIKGDRSDRGTVRVRLDVNNQDEDTVMSMVDLVMVERRPE